MNCTHINRLLALFIGGDLPLQQADLVRAHLFACQHCSDLAAEFEASASWLDCGSRPDFNERFFEELRDSVWRGIHADQTPGWRVPGWGWALATAIVLLFCGVLFFSPRVRMTPSATDTVRLEPAKESTAEKTPSSNRRSGQFTAARPRYSVKRADATLRPIPNPTSPTIEMITRTLQDVASTTGPIMRRMEIQTADPNVRIIWLTPDRDRARHTEIDTDDRSTNLSGGR